MTFEQELPIEDMFWFLITHQRVNQPLGTFCLAYFFIIFRWRAPTSGNLAEPNLIARAFAWKAFNSFGVIGFFHVFYRVIRVYAPDSWDRI